MLANKKDLEEKLKLLEREAEEREAERRAKKFGYNYISAATMPINIEALALVSEEQAKEAKLGVIEKKDDKIAIAVFNPNLPVTQAVFNNLKNAGYKLNIYIVSLSSLFHIWDFYKFIPKKQRKITGAVEIAEEDLRDLEKKLFSIEAVKELLQEVTATELYTSQLLEIILAGAIANRVSDVHLEPEEEKVKLRFRIDGILHDVFNNFKKYTYSPLLNRIKLVSRLKINVHNEPQDGRFSIKLPNKTIDVRVAVAPAEFGEVVVMRLLDPDVINLSLNDLGLREDDLAIIQQELKKPNGMILNTGPTGAGKTTTLYAFLKYKKSPEIKIITVEDPIEYQLEGIEQTQVDESSGYVFASALRSIVRQDPDIILVGEIRDKETAEIALQSALTGHLVFSTLHTNQAAGAIPRLLDLGVRPSSIGPALNLIIAQRLVRRLCEFCKEVTLIDDSLRNKVNKFLEKIPERVDRNYFKEIKIYQARGCEKCNHLGYKGRIAIYELFLINSEIEELINKETSEFKLQEIALKQGMVTLQQDGILKVIIGTTTFEEVESVTGPLQW
jgi:type II secretory ATPase GspE/PulE/Tfp pilus assembly ATPase PilB-like protein